MAPSDLTVRPYEPPRDEAWAETVVVDGFGDRVQVRRGEPIDVLTVPGLVSEAGGEPVGLLMYVATDGGTEIVVLVAGDRRRGVGTALLDALRSAVGGPIRVVTTNDNVDALRFYQRRGFRLLAVRPGAVDETRRRWKPHLPAHGDHGIPLRDELELEWP